MTYFPETIMCTYEGMQVDPLTQYLVGWTDTLPSKAQEFMTRLQEYTVARYQQALTLEFFRNKEELLLQQDIHPYHSLTDLQRQADKCDPWAEFLLGLSYRDGIGVAADITQAERYFARSGKTGLNLAAYAYAQLLVCRGARSAREQEELWLILNYNSGNHLQLASLRIACLLTGVGGRTNRQWAMDNTLHQYQENEAFLPFAKRSAWFFRILEKLSRKLPALNRAVQQLQQRYDRMLRDGDPDLLYLVAQMLESGQQVQKDLSGAFTLYTLSAKNGNRLACRALARCYRNGLGAARDLNAAQRWLEQAELCRRQYPWDAFCRLMEP